MSRFAVLANKNYRHLFFAQIISLAGTGIGTIALSLLAWNLAGDQAGEVLGVALALKMVAYVVLAPIFGAYAHKFPRKHWLIMLNAIRLGLVLVLPLVTEIWQIYLLIFVINTCAAGYTPVYQSLLPEVLPDQDQYIRALSFSRLAYDLEQLLSPILAAALLTVVSFKQLFVVDAVSFLIAALFLLPVKVPKAKIPERQAGILNNLTFGIRSYLATPRLRALWAAYLSVACGSAMLIVNTVVYTRQYLNSGESQTALAMSVAGFGSMLVAIFLLDWLKNRPVRPVILTGAFIITGCLSVGIWLPSWTVFLCLWLIMGMGLSLVQTPAGALVKRSCQDSDAPAFFAANFSLSHLCWFSTYLLAGWSSSQLGLSGSFALMALLSLVGLILCLRLFPKHDPEHLEHQHRCQETGNSYTHSHRFVIDKDHSRWPSG